MEDWATYKEGKYAPLSKISTIDLIKYLANDFNESEANQTPVKYLKTWTGIITNSFAGRDDGYPETKYALYDSLEKMAENFNKFKNEKYYKLVDVQDEIEKIIETAHEEELELNEIKKRRKLKMDIKKLQDELASIDDE